MHSALRVRWLVSLVAAALLCAACSSSGTGGGGSGGASGNTVKLQYYPGYYGSWLSYIAYAQGFYKKNGVDAHMVGVSGGTAAAAGLASGSVNTAELDVSLAGPLIAKGMKLTAISGLLNDGWKIVAPGSEHLPTQWPDSIKSLKGKTIGVVALGTSSYFFARALVQAAGLSPDSVTYAAIGAGAPSAVSAIQSKRVAAAVVSGEGTYVLVNQQHDTLLFDFSDPNSAKLAGPMFASLAGQPLIWMWASTSWVDSHKDLVRKMELSLMEADVWMHKSANLSTVKALLSKEKGIPKFAQGSADQYLTAMLPKPVSYLSRSGVEAYNAFWRKAGVLKSPLSIDQVYFPGIAASGQDVYAKATTADPSLK